MIAIMADINEVANIVVLALLVVTALAVVRSRNLLNATIFTGIFSVLMATEYLILGAPDVAITEATVGAGISTILLLLGLFLVGEKEKKHSFGKLPPFILISIVAGVLMYASLELPQFGANDTPAQLHVGSYYVTNSVAETGVQNTVTSVLASYRGYDTLGETIVIFTAGLAVFMLLGRLKNGVAK